MKTLAFTSVVVVAALGLAGAAAAHPHIKTTSPSADAVLSASPAKIEMSFNEPLVAAFSGLEVVDRDGHAANLSPATLDAQDKGRLVAQVKSPLAPGTYTVKWHAVAADTHHVSGAYSFQIKP